MHCTPVEVIGFFKFNRQAFNIASNVFTTIHLFIAHATNKEYQKC